MKLFAWGLFKKLYIADSLAVYVNYVYSSTAHSGCAFLLATLFYSFQLYCDFSGYSDMAIGVGKFLGFDLGLNFNKPYLASSVSDFWHRWHISLSTWLKDYIYIPCGGSRVALPRIYLNLMITFIVSGFWHGASWTFVIWGMLHGLFQCVERLTRKSEFVKKTPVLIKIFITFTLVSFSWIFFRAESLSDAMIICRKMVFIPWELRAEFMGGVHAYGLLETIKTHFVLVESVHGLMPMAKKCLTLILFIILEIFCEKKSGLKRLEEMHVLLRWILYFSFVFFILFNCMQGELSSNFIYNNF